MAKTQTAPFHVKVYDDAGNLIAEGPCTRLSTGFHPGGFTVEGAFYAKLSSSPRPAHTLSRDAHAVRPPPAPAEDERRPCWNCGMEGLGKQVVGQPCKRCGKTV